MLVEPWLARSAAARPHATAVEAPEGSLSYSDLLARASALAASLRERGVTDGDRVAITTPAGLDFTVALHATHLAGAVAVPVDPRLGEIERSRVTAEARAVLDRGAVERGIERALGEDGGDGHFSDANGRARTRARPRPLASEIEHPPAHALAAPAILIFTSGTSAAPKPVTLTFGNLLWSALGSAVALGLDHDERWLCTMPLAHVGGLSILVRSAIYGTTAVLHERFETERVLGALRDEGITLVSLVATTLERLLDAGLQRPAELRCALVGGGPVPPELLARADDAEVPARATYGLSEACSQVATVPVAPGDGGARPLFCTKVEIAADGEILVAGPTVATGAADADGWLHTGDLGHIDAAGGLHVEGRRGDMIVSGGENVSPAEVERALESHADVVEAAVVGCPDARWGEAVTAVVVGRPGAAIEVEALRRHCAAVLAGFKVPKRVDIVPGPLPRTASGKLLRRVLRGDAESTAPPAPPFANGAPKGARAGAGR